MLGKVNEYSDKKKEEKKQEEAYNSEASKTERQIRTFIDNIYSAIKDKDYAYISMCLDKNYNECIFDNSIENLKEYIENNIVIDDSYIISKISQDEGLYQVLIGVQSENSYNTQTFTVNVIDENECELMLGEYSSFKKNNEIAKYSNLSYNLVYNYRTPDIVSYLIDITNFTDEEIVIEFNETSATSSSGKVYKGILPKTIKIEAGKTERIEAAFLKQLMTMNSIQLNVKENGKEKKVEFIFDDHLV